MIWKDLSKGEQLLFQNMDLEKHCFGIVEIKWSVSLMCTDGLQHCYSLWSNSEHRVSTQGPVESVFILIMGIFTALGCLLKFSHTSWVQKTLFIFWLQQYGFEDLPSIFFHQLSWRTSSSKLLMVGKLPLQTHLLLRLALDENFKKALVRLMPSNSRNSVHCHILKPPWHKMHWAIKDTSVSTQQPEDGCYK